MWWRSFIRNGVRYQQSTKQGNKRVAEQIEAAHKTALAKGQAGIAERKPPPSLRTFSERFMADVRIRKAEKQLTISFVKAS